MNRSILLAFLLTASPALADDSFTVAFELGTMIGSEAGCGLTFDQAAIKAFIEAKVPEPDMGFMSTMNTMAEATGLKFKDFTASQKTAHCTQVGRAAKANGFVK